MNLKSLGIDPFKYFGQLPPGSIQFRLMDRFMNFFVPFNRNLGFKIHSLDKNCAIIYSPKSTRRKNHVGTTHACALALLGEYPAGLLLAQNYSVSQYRMIITSLNAIYHKPGVGLLTAIAKRPLELPGKVDGETSIEMITQITNSKKEPICTCHTQWQIKEWQLTRHDRQSRD